MYRRILLSLFIIIILSSFFIKITLFSIPIQTLFVFLSVCISIFIFYKQIRIIWIDTSYDSIKYFIYLLLSIVIILISHDIILQQVFLKVFHY